MPLPEFNPGGSYQGSSEPERRANPVVGGYAFDAGFRQLSGSIAGGGTYAPVFDPYRERDQRRILGRLVNQGTILDLQEALVRAGLLDDTEVAFGYLDGDTEDAFAHILSIANQHGLDWRDVLSQAAAGGGIGGNDSYGGGGSGSGGLAPEIVTLPNRDDLVRGAQDFTLSQYGQRIDDDLSEVVADSMLDSLRTQQERQVQQLHGTDQEGGVIFAEAAPDVNRLLEEEIEERAPDLVFGKAARDLADLWFESMAGPV